MRKPKILTRLRVDEVSSVDRGAGEGVKIVLMKRHNGDAVLKHDNGDYSYLPSWAAKDLMDTLPPRPMLFNDIMYAKLAEEHDDEDGDDTVPPDKLEQMISALISEAPSLRREDAANFLLHTPRGRRLAEHLSSTIVKTRKEEPIMDRTEQLCEFVKQGGSMAAVAKHIIAKGSTAATEHEFTAALTEHCRLHKMAGESDPAAFSRIFSAPESIELRKAHSITKNTPAPQMSITPTSVEVGSSVTPDDSKAAYDKLTEMAKEQRRRSPTLTVAQAFERVFSAPENAKLASAAHRRPSAADAYAFPR